MSNLRTILEDLISYNGIDAVETKEQAISQAEQRIGELIPTRDKLAVEILVAIRGCGYETARELWTGAHYQMEDKRIADRVSTVIHSAMMKKLQSPELLEKGKDENMGVVFNC